MSLNGKSQTWSHEDHKVNPISDYLSIELAATCDLCGLTWSIYLSFPMEDNAVIPEVGAVEFADDLREEGWGVVVEGDLLLCPKCYEVTNSGFDQDYGKGTLM